MQNPDVADVHAAAAGDEAAFARLVRAHQGRVWRYVVHLVGNAATAEDITQEVFLRVHRRVDTLRDPEKFLPWLLTLARNAAYDAGRAKARRPLHLVDDASHLPAASVPDPHLRLEITDAMARLDGDLREALMLVGVIGLSYEEAAETIGIPEGTVKSRVYRARQTLLVALGMESRRD